jgi:hypothetical protein
MSPKLSLWLVQPVVALHAQRRLPYSGVAMGCSIRVNRHGYLGFRLFWNGIESHEGTKLRDTPSNRAKVEARSQVINEEIESGHFNYTRWFPDGNAAWRFRQPEAPEPKPVITVKGFFDRWRKAAQEGDAQGAAVGSKYGGLVSAKWISNRTSCIRSHVVPFIGDKRLDELTTLDLMELQARLSRRGKKPGTIDGVVHSRASRNASGRSAPRLRRAESLRSLRPGLHPDAHRRCSWTRDRSLHRRRA